jgi:SAM-dependent methyltransferase
MEQYLTIPDNFSSDDYYRFKKLNSVIQNIIAKKGKKGIVFVDFGCGDGQFMQYIQKNSSTDIRFKFIGIDKFVSRKAFDFELRNCDVEEKIDLPDNFADIIVGAEIIEHIRNTDVLISEMLRIVKSDGDILITTPNLSSYFNRFLLLFGYQPYHSEVSDKESGFGQGLIYRILGREKYGNKTAGHLRLFTFRAFRDFIKYNKLKLVRYYPVFFSSFRSDNKRVTVIRLFFVVDKCISLLFPSLASGMIFHLKGDKIIYK